MPPPRRKPTTGRSRPARWNCSVYAPRGALLHRERRPPRRAGHDRRRAAGAAHWPGQSALGRRLAVDPGGRHAGHLDHRRWRRAARAAPQPDRGGPRPGVLPRAPDPTNPAVYLIKTAGDPAALTGLVRDAVRSLDPALPIYDVRPAPRPTSTTRGPCGVSPRCSRCSSPRRHWRWPASASTASSPIRSPSGIASSGCGWRSARGRSQVLGMVLREGAPWQLPVWPWAWLARRPARGWLRSQLFGVTPGIR